MRRRVLVLGTTALAVALVWLLVRRDDSVHPVELANEHSALPTLLESTSEERTDPVRSSDTSSLLAAEQGDRDTQVLNDLRRQFGGIKFADDLHTLAINGSTWAGIRAFIERNALTSTDVVGICDRLPASDPLRPLLILAAGRARGFDSKVGNWLVATALSGATGSAFELDQAVAATQALRYAMAESDLADLTDALVKAGPGRIAPIVLRLCLDSLSVRDRKQRQEVLTLATSQSTPLDVRQAAWRALGKAATAEELGIIISSARAGDPTALQGVSAATNPDAVPLLKQLLDDTLASGLPDLERRDREVAAMSGLLSIGNDESIYALDQFIANHAVSKDQSRLHESLDIACRNAHNPLLLARALSPEFLAGASDQERAEVSRSLAIVSVSAYWHNRRMPTDIHATLVSALRTTITNLPGDSGGVSLALFHLIEWGSADDAEFISAALAKSPNLMQERGASLEKKIAALRKRKVSSLPW